MKLKLSTKLILFAIIFLAAALRFYGINWDQGFHLHPDERAIILTINNLRMPQTFVAFFSPQSLWNPHFFAYGSLPFYLLYFVGHTVTFLNPLFADYSLLQIPGRCISAISDLLTIFVLFLLSRKLFNTTVGLYAAFFYAISVLPIQLSHFYAVDTLLTLFILITLYLLVNFYEKPTMKKGVAIGIFFGAALATKVSALVLVSSIGVSLLVDFILLFVRQPHKPNHWLPHVPAFLKHLSLYAIIITITTFATFIFFEPYAVIDFQNFWLQTQQQSAMTKDAFTFPYTLQYVGKVPYLYEIKNIFFFGLGPIITVLAGIGIFLFLHKARKKEFILFAFFLTYFLVVGKFAIGFMRYMLPLYPLFCLFAALTLSECFNFLRNKTSNRFILNTIYFILYTSLLIWPLSFIQIYNNNNTRVDATNWILNNIPPGKTLAVEHWDDQLPLINASEYPFVTLALYEPDSLIKWQTIGSQLEKTDYIIIASNRLYTPLQKLTNCAKLPAYRCYLQTDTYYKQLFGERMGFKKVAEFSNYPTVPFLNTAINDQSADESFTVYDHPKVMIFKKIYNE